MTGVWLTIDSAPKDRPVDLWGTNKTDAQCEGLMMDPRLYVRRWTDCRWHTPLKKTRLGLYIPTSDEPAWYFQDGDNWVRIYPTHWMAIPSGPTSGVYTDPEWGKQEEKKP